MANEDAFRDVHLSIYGSVTQLLSPRRTKKRASYVPVVYVPVDRNVDRAVYRAVNLTVVLATFEDPPVPGLRRYLKTVVR